MFSCSLCEKEPAYFKNHCEICREIKNIMNVYGHKEILEILKRVCIRNPTQQTYKIDKELKDDKKK